MEHVVVAPSQRRDHGLVRPAEAEREVRLARGEHFVERALEQPLSRRTSSGSSRSRECRARAARSACACARLRQPQVVEAEVARHVRLVVTRGRAESPARRWSTR